MLVPLIFEAVRTGHIHLIINFQCRRNAISLHIPNFRSKPIQFLTLIKIPSNKIHAERKGLVVTIGQNSEKKYRQQRSKCIQNFTQVMQIPFQIEIDLDPDHRYHSVFACPILRQQTSEDNPPMKLSCGHVISRDALNKLSNGLL